MMPVDHFLDRFAAGLLHVADGDELHVLLLQEAAQVVRASIADADAAQHDSLAGGDGAVEPQGRAGNDLGAITAAPAVSAVCKNRRRGSFVGLLGMTRLLVDMVVELVWVESVAVERIRCPRRMPGN